MRILLIGGTRFLGKSAVSDLASRGHQVVVLNRGNLPEHPDAAATIQCDKQDRKSFAAAMNQQRWDAVIDTILNDADLEFVIEQLAGKVGHFIHTGSIGVYAPAQRVPTRECDPLAAHDAVYNFSYKLLQDQVLMRAHLERSFPFTSLRMSYIYGPGDVPLDGWGGRCPDFFTMLSEGQTIPLANDGAALLHPGHVDDLGRAFGDALQSPNSIGQIYNIGGPYALMMRDYIRLISEVMGASAELEFVTPQTILSRFPQLTNERGLLFACEHMCCDVSKAERDLGWRPRIPLKKGIEDTLSWMRQHGHKC